MDYCGLTVTVVWKMFLGLNFAGPYWWKLPQNPTQSHVGFPQLTPDETMKHTREVYHRAFWKKVVLRRVDHFSGVNLQFNFQGGFTLQKTWLENHLWFCNRRYILSSFMVSIFHYHLHFPRDSPGGLSPSCSVAFQVSEVRDFGEAWSLDFRWMDGFGSPPSTGRGVLGNCSMWSLGRSRSPKSSSPTAENHETSERGMGDANFEVSEIVLFFTNEDSLKHEQKSHNHNLPICSQG